MSQSPARWALIVALLAQLSLALGLMLWSGWIAGAVLSAPLLLTLPGLLRSRPRAAAYCGYLMILYVAMLLAEAYAQRERYAVGLTLAGIAALSFIALILFVRWSARDRTLQAGVQADVVERTESSAAAER